MKKYKQSISSTDGFTLLEVLIALLCISLATVLFVQCTAILKKMSKPMYQSEDRIAIYQLRLLLAQSENLRIQDKNLYFTYAEKENHFELHNRRLVRKSGYEIFLQDIDAFNIREEKGCFHVYWNRQKMQKKALLACGG